MLLACFRLRQDLSDIAALIKDDMQAQRLVDKQEETLAALHRQQRMLLLGLVGSLVGNFVLVVVGTGLVAWATREVTVSPETGELLTPGGQRVLTGTAEYRVSE